MNIFQEIAKDNKPEKVAAKPNANPFSEDFDEFLKWHHAFMAWQINYNAPSSDANLKDWFNKVQKGHQDIRKKIGGIRVESELIIPERDGEASSVACGPIIDEIFRLLPTYTLHYNFPSSVLLKPIIEQAEGIKTSKHILFYAKNIVKLPPDKFKILEGLIAKMGEKWAAAKIKNEKLYITLTTAAKAFASLGHYGPDVKSCFRNQGENSGHKYNLGQREDTFICIIRDSRMPEPFEERNSLSTMARCWGWFNQTEKVVNFCNFYTGKRLPVSNAVDVLRKKVAILLDEDDGYIRMQENNIDVTGYPPIYHNKEKTDWTFYIKNGKEKPTRQGLT